MIPEAGQRCSQSPLSIVTLVANRLVAERSDCAYQVMMWLREAGQCQLMPRPKHNCSMTTLH